MLTRRSIDAALVDEVTATMATLPLDESSVSALRRSFPGVHFSYCFDDDVATATPVRSTETFRLYLVASSHHCLQLTPSMEAATGFLVAELLD